MAKVTLEITAEGTLETDVADVKVLERLFRHELCELFGPPPADLMFKVEEEWSVLE
jgi:hypothetical protein